MANNIVEFNINGTSYTQRPYGTCSTAAGTAAKVVTCSGFNLVTGATVMVKFTNANTVANPTLNVNSKGAKAIYYRGAALTASSLANWGAGDVVEFRYNGTQWDLLNVGNTIPSIGNGTITIKQNGTSKGSFTVNQTGNTTIELTDTAGEGEANVQSDWNVTDTTSDAYIKNKPTIPAAVTVDSTLSSTSTNPVQNKIIHAALNDKVNSDDLATVATSGSYNDLTNKPTITDTKVTQTVTSSNANYPILLAPSGQTATTTTTSYFDSGISCNPSSNALNVDTLNIKTSGTGGTIFFGDKDGDTDGYVYIKEDTQDRLLIAADMGMTLSTGFNCDGGDLILKISTSDYDQAAVLPFKTSSGSQYLINLGRTDQRFYDGYFSNQVFAANGFYESSDERLKDFGEGLRVDLDALSKLRKSYFTFKDKPEDPQIGVSAQEIQKLYPEVVIETSDGHLNVDYAKLSVVALAAIDQLNDKVKSLEDRLARLEKLLENK